MKLLIAVDSLTTLEILLDAMMARSWPVAYWNAGSRTLDC